MKNGLKTFLFYGVMIIAVIIVAQLFMGNGSSDKLQYGDILTYFKEDKVKSFEVNYENKLTMKLTDDTAFTYNLLDINLLYNDLMETDFANGKNYFEFEQNLENYNFKAPDTLPWWFSVLPYLIVIGVLIAIWVAFINNTAKNASSSSGTQNSGGGLGGRMNSFSRARTKLGSDEKVKILFTDVAGAEEEKEELTEVVDFLKDPGKYEKLGAKIPRGVLLMGAPGTGKTLLAKAVAGEAGVPFYSISGSDFVEMYVGVGASRVRDLFETARKTSPCIIFIDEIDAVGRHRGAGWGGGHDEREQTLNQLLVEMDGFGGTGGVIVMAATNRPDILDPALLRPGRFDRQITVNYPDIKGREEILKVHARKKPLDYNEVDLSTVAKSTAGFTGADLANLLNESALLAARKKKTLIGTDEIEEALIKVIVGPQKHSRVIKEQEKRATAFHEAGHALVTKYLAPNEPVHQISIIPSGRALGYTLSLPQEDKNSIYKKEMENEIAVLLGGRVAEALTLGDISGGASNDIQRATEIARKMVTQYGMSDTLGPIVFGTGHDEVFLGKDFSSTRNYSEDIASNIDKEIHLIISTAYAKAEKILKENMDKLHFITEYLVKNEIMDAEQFEAVFHDETCTEEALDAIKEQKKAKSKARNEAKREEEQRKLNEEKLKQSESDNNNSNNNDNNLPH